MCERGKSERANAMRGGGHRPTTGDRQTDRQQRSY